MLGKSFIGENAALPDSNPSKIEFDCPSCLKSVSADRSQINVRIVCPHCQRSLVVPSVGKQDPFGDLFDDDVDPAEPTADRDPAGADLPTGGRLAASDSDDDSDSQAAATELEAIEPSHQFEFELPSAEQVQALLREQTGVDPARETGEAVDSPASSPAANDVDIADLVEPAHEALPDVLEFLELDAQKPIPEPDPNAVVPEDPFQDDPDRPLSIEGLTDGFPSSESISVVCPICDTRILVNAASAGDQVKCPECFSTFAAVARKSRKSNSWLDAAKAMQKPGAAGDQGSKTTPSESASSAERALKEKFGMDDGIRSHSQERIFEEDSPEIEGHALAPIAIPTQPVPQFAAKTKGADDREDPAAPSAGKADDDDDELRLAPPEEREALEAPMVPLEDDPFFNAEDHPEPEEENGSPDGDGVQLDETQWAPTNRSQELPTAGAKSKRMPSAAEMPEDDASESATGRRNRGPYAAPESTYVDPEEQEQQRNPFGMQLSTLGSFDGKVSKWLNELFRDGQLMIRLGLAVAALTLGYTLFDWLWAGLLSEGASTAYKSIVFVFAGVPGLLLFLLGWGIVLAVGGVLFERAGSLKPRYEDWESLSIRDYLPKLGFLLFSLWIASLPGVFFGLLIVAISQELAWLGVAGSLAAMMLSPLLLVAAAFNGSPFQIVSSKLTPFLGTAETDWLRFIPASLSTWLILVVGIIMLVLPGIVFSLIGAVIQVFAVIAFASLTGLYAGLMNERMEQVNATRKGPVSGKKAGRRNSAKTAERPDV